MNCNLSQVDKKSLVKEEQTMQCHSPILNMFVNMSWKEVLLRTICQTFHLISSAIFNGFQPYIQLNLISLHSGWTCNKLLSLPYICWLGNQEFKREFNVMGPHTSIYHTWLLMESMFMVYQGSLFFWYFSFTIQLIGVCLDSHCIYFHISMTSYGHFMVSVSIL